MKTEDIIEVLDMEVDKRLYQLSKKQLIKLLTKLIGNLRKKELTSILTDDKYFDLNTTIKTLEKIDKKLLAVLLNEPSKEKEMRNPIRNWLRETGYKTSYEVPLPNAGRRRFIDVCGFKGGGSITKLLGGEKIIGIECKARPTRGSIDKAFSQAKDYQECSDFTYVAVTPHMFLKYPEVILKKAEANKGLGLLLVDKSRVLS